MRNRPQDCFRLIILALLCCFAPPALDVSADEMSLVSDPIQGRRVFEQKNCSQCHSIFDDKGKLGPELQISQFRGSFLDIFSLLWNHAPTMAVHMKREGLPQPHLNTREFNELISFLYLLPYLGEPGDPEKGEQLLEEKTCFNCHSLAGKGNEEGLPLDSLAAFRSEVVLMQRMWNHVPSMIDEMSTAGTPIPTFSGDDMRDLFAALAANEEGEPRKIYLAVGDAANGEKLFGDRGCQKCHSLRGEEAGVGPDLSEAGLQESLTELTSSLWNHAAEMQESFREIELAWPEFSESEMSDLIVFLYSLNYTDSTGNPEAGKNTFNEKRCAECHFRGDTDRQELVDKVKSANPAQFAALLWNHVPTMEKSMMIRDIPWPELTGEQLRDVLAFLRSQ